MTIHPTLDEWIARDAIHFVFDDAASFNAAVDRVVGVLGESVQLLGFGEALHGSEEILVARNRLFSDENGIGPPEPGTLEARLLAAG